MKRTFTFFAVGVAMLLLAVTATTTFAAVGSNGGFELGTVAGTYVTVNAGDSTTITDWSVATGTVDYINSYWQPSEGSRNVDLNGVTAGTITQNLTTVIGAKYDVTFDLSGNPDSTSDTNHPYWSPSLKTVAVGATGTSSQSFSFDTAVEGNTLANMMWKPKAYSFVATATTTTLSFASQISGAFGPAVDNIVITETLPAPTGNQCKNGGWKTMNDGLGHKFKNQGDCVSFFATQGKNVGAGGNI